MIYQTYVDCNGKGNCNGCKHNGSQHITLELPCGDTVDIVLNCEGKTK